MDDTSLRRRVARLGAITVALLGVTVVLIALAVVSDLELHPRHVIARLPVDAKDRIPSITALLAVGAAAAAAFLALAALNVAAAMRVLARDRRIPPQLPPELRRLRAVVLSPLGRSAVQLASTPPLPATKLPDELELRGVTALRLTALLPAHNEALTIGASLESLRRQSRPPDRVIVVADNCTDETVEVARRNGAEVFTTVGNTEMKAGALNQALAQLFDDTDLSDVVLVMDADSIIVPGFLETAMSRLEAQPDLIAVGGVFGGEEGAGLVGQLQRNEYSRYRRHISRRRGKVFVLTGTASVFRAYALKAVAESRGELIPGDPGRVYDTLAMTEDNEITLALKSLGAKMVSPRQCLVVTEVMPTWHALWRQRTRWQRGALENIAAYGFTRATAIYWLQQLGIGYGTIALNAYLLLMLITLLSADGFQILWFWFVIGLIFIVERVVTVWAGGWRGRLLAFPLVIELAYAVVLQIVFTKSLIDIVTGRAAGWNYVPREEVRQ